MGVVSRTAAPMKIGPIELGPRPLFLAPMEDVSDPPFRLLCKRYGADMLFTEFVSSGGLVHASDDCFHKLDIYDEERPVGIQIFGGEVDQVREAAAIVDARRPDVIDINFGCPVKKVVCHDGGAGILRNIPKMMQLTEAVLAVATRPVTVKTRLGWSDDTIRILDVARMLEERGVAALTVHARTRAQMYKGEARWDWLRRVKAEGVRDIPLIGNGDATTPEKVRQMFEETGVDGVMIGRGAIGNPWIFRDTRRYLETGELPPPPSWEERRAVAAEHLSLKCDWLGEVTGVLEMRRMYGGYFKGFRGASTLRTLLMGQDTKAGVLEILLNFRVDEPDVQVAVPALPKAAVKKVDLPVPA
jgi:tRNA-dihydrouridine synthase B